MPSATAYPQWSYYPRNTEPAPWALSIVQVVADAEPRVSTPSGVKKSSDAVLLELAPGLRALGYDVEAGKRAADKITRPVLYGDSGSVRVKYEIDGWHPELGVAVEVEAGRGAASNADYRDIVRMSLLLDAKFMCLLLPQVYRSTKQTWHAFRNTNEQLDAIYASQRLRLPFEGVLLVGY